MSEKPWQPSLIDLWIGALAAEVGISVKTNDRRLLQSQLYRERQANGTKEMENVAICIPDLEGELWMVKKTALEKGDA